jgi:hypothetical protein
MWICGLMTKFLKYVEMCFLNINMNCLVFDILLLTNSKTHVCVRT